MLARNATLIKEKIPKSALKHFLHEIAPISGLPNEIICILVAQETAKLPKVKVGGLKSILPLSPICSTQVQSTSFESTNKEKMDLA